MTTIFYSDGSMSFTGPEPTEPIEVPQTGTSSQTIFYGPVSVGG